MSPKKNVVIVGGGGGGARLARALSAQLDSTRYNLILISPFPFYPHYVAGIRTLVTSEGSLEDQIFIPFDKLFIKGNGKFKQGVVTRIEATKDTHQGGSVILESGETIQYDVLALAPGGKWEAFLDLPYDDEKLREHISEWRNKFRKANKIVIAGGGAVGLELAGEIREYYPNKAITVVHADKKLLNPAYPDKFRLKVERLVRNNNVRLILDDAVDSFPATATRKGVPLDADLVIPARGPRPNTAFIASSLGQDTLNDRNLVRIRPTMQLMSYPSIFAVGDVIDYAEQKQVAKYDGHAAVASANIVSLLNGAEPKKPYKGFMAEMIFLTFGKSQGAGYADILWGLTFGNWVVSLVKSKGLFVTMTRKALGQSS